ncbi:hypothetical protein HOH87_06930 [bacterium]|jgi:hypothetical protein|nr:hypothetical protein [bacterium]
MQHLLGAGRTVFRNPVVQDAASVAVRSAGSFVSRNWQDVGGGVSTTPPILGHHAVEGALIARSVGPISVGTGPVTCRPFSTDSRSGIADAPKLDVAKEFKRFEDLNERIELNTIVDGGDHNTLLDVLGINPNASNADVQAIIKHSREGDVSFGNLSHFSGDAIEILSDPSMRALYLGFLAGVDPDTSVAYHALLKEMGANAPKDAYEALCLKRSNNPTDEMVKDARNEMLHNNSRTSDPNLVSSIHGAFKLIGSERGRGVYNDYLKN